MASIGWQGVSIAVATVLVGGCAGLLFFARELAQDTLVQPVIGPVKHQRAVRSSRLIDFSHAHEMEHIPQDTAETGREVEVMILMQAASEGLTRIRIIEEVHPLECWCDFPFTDRAYVLSARECGSICACVNENDSRISQRVELFPAE